MSRDDRIARLRALAARLERLPLTDVRERTLQDVRVRIADLQTGQPTQAMRGPAEDPPPANSRARTGRPNGGVAKRPPPAPPAHREPPATPQPATPQPARPPGDAEPVAPAQITDDVLWLADDGDDDTGQVDRWKRGLRG